MVAKQDPSSTVHLRIKRQDKPGAEPYWQQFEVERRTNANVISVLQQVAADPVTASGERVTPVVWDCNCLEEVCGACTMLVNGVCRQSCSTLVHELAAEGFGTQDKPIVLEPMSKFPVVRDLWCDRSRMYDNLKRIKGWVPIDSTADLGPGPKESPESQDLRYGLSRCMTCGCCLEACPQFTFDNDFVGAQIFGQSLFFNMHDTGKKLAGDRLAVMEGPGGITDCGNAQNCVEVCPKEVPLLDAIARIGRQTTVHAIKRFFAGK